MTTFISFLIVLGILIFIHELGHFAVAKACGVGVEKFSLGFGPKLIGVRRGETEYRISALPLGGYVKMVGEAPGEEITEELRAKSFTHKPVWKKAAIVAAGPVMNLVLAIALLPVIFMIGIQVPLYLEKPAQAGYVVPGDAASKAGIRNGDIINTVNGKAIKTWEELLGALTMSPGKTLEVGFLRDGQRLNASLVPETSEKTGAGYGGLYPPMEPVIGDISPGFPAKEAGLKPGDRIISVNGTPIVHWAELEVAIHKSGDKKTFVIRRGAEELSLVITPRYSEEAKAYLVGISRQEDQVLRRYGLIESIDKGVSSGIDMTSKLFVVIKGLVLGEYSLKTLGGPIMIAQVAGKAAESGLVDILSLVAFLSLQLGIINLFPIPVLDGGHIVFFSIEAVKGSPLSEKFMTVAQQVGIALLVALMVLVTYNDLFRIFG
ncbi:MAG TPA: RIP metalloprotease RseP [Deltaproteobacteria bacterium]|nr:MAG: RIP metalloprotease RseP [Deltaproteobacteria bacterium GWA2_55_82]OGQ63281.1 MAG: RIP metalloprotease RseP [Deltaproteobacteria bacterium RIFCSPLOWO2_02_FULL_55_12]OIJ73116.1 MAG: RIP metalloprotease RseP [Deltaproteobacteria bacterium GWC2_55_46]HBG47882.1 RIP metalloprotease RseP [Deltaproteobacteria bacterium]HCY11855.1 RIP metalloprotease RseP [Deltaproteobacteria bacterium]